MKGKCRVSSKKEEGNRKMSTSIRNLNIARGAHQRFMRRSAAGMLKKAVAVQETWRRSIVRKGLTQCRTSARMRFHQLLEILKFATSYLGFYREMDK